MRLDLVRGGKAHQEAIVDGVRMLDGLKRLLEFLLLALVLVERNLLRKSDDRRPIAKIGKIARRHASAVRSFASSRNDHNRAVRPWYPRVRPGSCSGLLLLPPTMLLTKRSLSCGKLAIVVQFAGAFGSHLRRKDKDPPRRVVVKWI